MKDEESNLKGSKDSMGSESSQKNSFKDLTTMAPRSPSVRVDGFVIIARTIDKCRAALAGKNGEYHFDCPLDNQLFGFMGIKGADFKAYVAEGHTDEEIAEWVRDNGASKTDAEIEAWCKKATGNNYSDNADKKAWLSGELVKLGLDKDGTLFEFLDADDKASFAKGE